MGVHADRYGSGGHRASGASAAGQRDLHPGLPDVAPEPGGWHHEAIRLDPTFSSPHYGLGNSLLERGDFEGAVERYRIAIRLGPPRGEFHCNRGHALRSLGRYGEALAEFRRGHELGSKQMGWFYPSLDWIRETERLAALEARMPALLAGREEPATADDALAVALVAYQRRRHAASARLFAVAFAKAPALAEDADTGNRYNAACPAALAGTGQGEDAAGLSAEERARLRAQAFAWLRADLEAWKTRLVPGGAKAWPQALATLAHWKQDPDLAGIRDEPALAALPEAERGLARTLWADLEILLERAR